METIIQQTINAFALGGIYALLALGLAVVFSVLRMINFAHGELITITGYGLLLSNYLQIPFVFAVLFAIIISTLSAFFMELIAFRPVRDAGGATMLITSFAVSMVLKVLFQNLISKRSKPVILPEFFSRSVEFFGLNIGWIQIISFLIVMSTLILLNFFFSKTYLGMAMRASADDFPVTRLMGVKANFVVSGTFAISGLLAGIAGILWVAQRASVAPFMGFIPVLKAFIASILGGLGSLTGAVAGGFVLGFIEIYSTAFLPEFVQPYKEPFGLSIVIVILLFRPSGLIPAKGVASVR
jgi:branched-chain amino acid transport system permease protein